MSNRPIGIPGPRIPLVGTIDFLMRPFQSFSDCQRRYGDPFAIYLPRDWYVVTSDPDNIRTIFALDPDASTAYGPEILAALVPFLGQGSLLAISGEPHKRDRKLLMPAFHGARMRAYGQIICDATLHFAEQWQVGHPFIMQETAQSISLDVIIKAVFGVLDPIRVEKYHRIVVSYVDSFRPSLMVPFLRQDFFGYGPWSQMLRSRQALEALLREEISERRRATDVGADILSQMLAARYDDGSSMSEVELISELLTLLISGHETTAIAITWVQYLLACHPEALAQLRAELDPLGPRPDPEEVAKLPYLDAVCNETLRMYPLAPWVLRRMCRPIDIKGYHLPAETMLAASIWLVHMRPDIYPEPQRFRPERFLSRKYAGHEFMPFGGGNRRCIGAAFAHHELKLITAYLVAGYELRCRNPSAVRPVRRNIVTIGPRGGVEMTLLGRRTQPSR